MNSPRSAAGRSLVRPGVWLAIALLSGWGGVLRAQTGPAGTNAPAVPAPIVIPQSTFDPKVRKDPFFPDSERLNPRPKPQAAETSPGTRPVAVRPKDPLEHLKLVGMSGSIRRRLVMINNATFELNEQATLRTAAGDLRVKVVEIRERSVLVTIDGGPEPKEIFLKED